MAGEIVPVANVEVVAFRDFQLARSEALPNGIDAKRIEDLGPLLPSFLRKSAQSIWQERVELGRAAVEVFDEGDGIHSVYLISQLSDLAAVSAYMSSASDKPYKKASYFFAVPAESLRRYAIETAKAEMESRCAPLRDLHYHMIIPESVKPQLFADIQSARCFNYRVTKHQMLQVVELSKNLGCLDYCEGPCTHCSRL